VSGPLRVVGVVSAPIEQVKAALAALADVLVRIG
jgi:hypothetical protein